MKEYFVGQALICHNNVITEDFKLNLTIGKPYSIISVGEDRVKIQDDKGSSLEITNQWVSYYFLFDSNEVILEEIIEKLRK